MTQIVLIRPGSTDYDEQGRIQGTLDIPLSSHGQQQVNRLIEELRDKGLSMIYHAPCEAAQQTATRIADALRIRRKKLDLLQNLDHGLWQGMLIQDVKNRQPRVYRQWQEQPETVCPPEGEMLAEAQQRIREAWKKLVRKHSGESIGLVVPEPLASLVRCELVRAAVGDLWKACEQTGCWELLPVDGEAVAPAP